MAALLASWQVAVGLWPNQFVLIGSPESLIVALPTYYSNAGSELLNDLWVTMLELVAGLIAGTVLGTAVGVVMAVFNGVREALRPVIIVINSVPQVAFAPLVIVWFGFGLSGKVVLVTLIVALVFAMNVLAAADDIDPIWLMHVKVLGGGTRRTAVRAVLLPAIVPAMLTSFRLGSGQAFRMVVFAEFIGSIAGLGFALEEFTNALDFKGVVVILLILVAIGLLIDDVTARVETRLTRWQSV